MLDKDPGMQVEQVLKARIKEHRRASTLENKPQLEAVKLSKLNGGDILDLEETSSIESSTSNNNSSVSQALAGYLFKSKSKSQENKKEDLISRSQSLNSKGSSIKKSDNASIGSKL